MAKQLKNGAIRLTAEDIAAYDRLQMRTRAKRDVEELVPRINKIVERDQIKAFYELDEDERVELFGDRL